MPDAILVTPRSVTRDGHPSLDQLRAAGFQVLFCRPGVAPDEEELRSLLPGCVGYLAGIERINARALETADRLRVISRNGTGTDAIDFSATDRLGITVLRAEGANARGVAELTIAHLLALARGIPAADAAIKSGGWSRPAVGMELEGRTLGLVGCGRVGQLVAQLALGLGLHVHAFDPKPSQDLPADPAFRLVSFEQLLADSDWISLHCPPAADGRPIIDAAALTRLKPGAFLLNTARHELVDPDAALDALKDGRLAGLAIDVFDTEPPTDRRLASHPRVVATPHLGGYTRESIDRAMTQAAENLIAFLGG
ncbi:MAG: phosphoglycerate dehydrogenase [Verrucomicrobiales bacterium]